MDEPTAEGPAPAQESSRSEHEAEASSRLKLFPPYAIVLLLTAAFSLIVASKGASAWHLARGSGGFPEETRRELVFALVFAYSVGMALVLAFLGELAASVLRLARRIPVGRVGARLGLSFLPLAVFGIGHRIINPWLVELMGELRQMLGGSAG